MSDNNGTPFPAEELVALVRAAEWFGWAAGDWLAWAGEVEGHALDAYSLLSELEQRGTRPIEGQTVPVVIEHVLGAIDAAEIDVEAAVIATLALRIIIRHYEIEAQGHR
jgi:hypothetical protein